MPTSREMLPRQRTDGASHRSFSRWSDELYCAGALDQRCPALGDSVTAGRCYWEVPPTWRAATEDDMNRTLHFQRWSMDRFNPPAAGVGSYRHYSASEAASCARGKRLLIAGDSTTRDTYYALLAALGHPISKGYPSDPQRYWPEGQFDPHPLPTGAVDAHGLCLGNFDKRRTCSRDVRWDGNRSSAAFHFLTRSNSSWELDLFSSSLGDEPLDAASCAVPGVRVVGGTAMTCPGRAHRRLCSARCTSG